MFAMLVKMLLLLQQVHSHQVVAVVGSANLELSPLQPANLVLWTVPIYMGEYKLQQLGFGYLFERSPGKEDWGNVLDNVIESAKYRAIDYALPHVGASNPERDAKILECCRIDVLARVDSLLRLGQVAEIKVI